MLGQHTTQADTLEKLPDCSLPNENREVLTRPIRLVRFIHIKKKKCLSGKWCYSNKSTHWLKASKKKLTTEIRALRHASLARPRGQKQKKNNRRNVKRSQAKRWAQPCEAETREATPCHSLPRLLLNLALLGFWRWQEVPVGGAAVTHPAVLRFQVDGRRSFFFCFVLFC